MRNKGRKTEATREIGMRNIFGFLISVNGGGGIKRWIHEVFIWKVIRFIEFFLQNVFL